ncbi:DUF305 domain-containing protein [Micromonospora sp. NBC_01813]|uniref:DUF305 domain-containing protein n=1 Tax=Micromonospora sp. NBC_01813 TaxID=2975988 RepID=UPI002DD82B0A|nr:DUF305 domain-containing protein [Micromonospora sp. NBC_01813]WSA10655.1 DUF305 domain-containing protein [Micromonospora sp. NBC_01813]
MTRSPIPRRVATALLVACLAGCVTAPPAAPHTAATTTPTTASSTATVRSTTGPHGTFNAVDVMFLQMTLDQHAAAAELTRLATVRSTDAQVRMLAAAIEVTQADEARTMSDWLAGWGQPTTPDPGASGAHGRHGDHAGHDALRGSTAADIALLAASPADEFDRTFLNILIAHQHNAVELARMARDAGTDPHVRDLAELIDRSRTAQISQMLTMLD